MLGLRRSAILPSSPTTNSNNASASYLRDPVFYTGALSASSLTFPTVWNLSKIKERVANYSQNSVAMLLTSKKTCMTDLD